MQLYASAKPGNTNNVILGTQVLKRLGVPMATKFTYKSEVGREMGCGVGDPPNANKLKKKKKRFSFRRISSSIPNTPEACISQNSPSICQEISEYSTYLPRSKKYNYHTFLNLHVQFARLVQLHRFSFYQDTSFGHEPVFSSVIKILTFTRSST